MNLNGIMANNMNQSSLTPLIVTSDCISNKSGDSVGVNGDGKKVAGGRVVLEYWCDKGRCETDSSTRSGYKENADGTVVFNSTDGNGKSLTINQFIEKYNDEYGLRSPLGGAQGGAGQMELFGIQFEYVANSFWDKLAEAYSGTHDTLNSFIWYDELGNGKKLDGTVIGEIGNATNMSNVVLATPFALSVLLPPEVWNAVFAVINSK
jgi:filamentous hemagglutinin